MSFLNRFREGQSEKKEELERLNNERISKLKECIEKNILPVMSLQGYSGIILKQNETVHNFSQGVSFAEEMPTRRTYGGGMRVMKGVFVGTSKSNYMGEVKRIDVGDLMLTSSRLIYCGGMRKKEYPLSKIISVKEYRDGIAIGLSHRKKSQQFYLLEPYFWAPLIRMAVEKKINKSAEPVKEKKLKRFCNQCGERVTPDCLFCSYCGAKM